MRESRVSNNYKRLVIYEAIGLEGGPVSDRGQKAVLDDLRPSRFTGGGNRSLGRREVGVSRLIEETGFYIEHDTL